MQLDKHQLDTIVQAICDRLDGEWLLLGGALVAIAFESRRTTEDVDVVGLTGTADERYKLLDLAAELKLPIETINSAADYFVRKIPGWRDHITPFRAGARGKLYRPDATLFVQLKMRRLSPADLEDCRAVLAAEHADTAILRGDLQQLAQTDDAALGKRREALRQLLESAK